MKKEIEILYTLDESIESSIKKLSAFENCGIKETLDVYYYDPLRKNLKPSPDGRLFASFRLRDKQGKYSMTYKTDHFEADTWSHSDEYEIAISDFKKGIEIVKALGLKDLVRVYTKKHVFQGSGFEIVLEEVAGLGNFIEIEYLDSGTGDVETLKEGIRHWVQDRGILVGLEMNAGKPELLLRAVQPIVEAVSEVC